MLSKSCWWCFTAKTLNNNESKFHILQISRLTLFTRIILSIIAFALPDIDISMLLLFLIEENIFFSDIKLSVRLWKIENAYNEKIDIGNNIDILSNTFDIFSKNVV